MWRFVILIILRNKYSICETKYDIRRSKLALETIKAETGNIAISPMLVRFSLCKLTSIANDSSRKELMVVLGIKSNNALQNCYKSLQGVISPLKDLDIILLNKLIVNYTDDIDPNFVKNRNDYGVVVDKVGFNYPKLAVTFINRWVERASYRRITDLLEATDIDNNTSVLAVSAAYVKLTWEFPFDIRLTKTMKFHHENGNVSLVEMMSKTDTYLYINDNINNIECVNIKLASVGLSVTIVVPHSSKNLNTFINKLYNDENILRGIYTRMRFETIKMMLPRFKIKTSIEWNKYLNKVGLNKIFNETDSGLNAILKGKSKIKNIFLSKVKQKVFVDVDEMGIFRQPPTKVHRFKSFEQSSQRQMTADRPFYFIIGLQPDLSDPLDIHELITGLYNGPAL